MGFFKEKPGPEHPDVLNAHIPSRRFDRDDMLNFIDVLRNSLVDGLLPDRVYVFESTKNYWRIRVDYGIHSRRVTTYEDIYVYKQYI